MGAAASVEGFQALSIEQQEEMKAKYDHLIAEGKTEEDAVSVLKADCDHKTSCIEEQPTLPFPKKGVKLSVLQKIVEDNKGKNFDCPLNHYNLSEGTNQKAFENFTTTDILKPIVRDEQCSYCEYLENHAQGHLVGIASVFISHAWKYTFVEVISALEYHFRNESDIFIWFDLVSNNQIQAPNLSFEWWSNTFKSAIEDFGRVVLILSPFDKPVVLTRGWCIFEIYCAVITGSKFELAMGQTQKDNFLVALSDDSGTYLQMLANVDVKKAECFNAKDRDNIFRFVDGLEYKDQTINRVVCAHLRDSVLEILRSSLDGLDEGEMASRKYDLAIVYQQQGQLDEALALYLEILPYDERKGGKSLGAKNLDRLMHVNDIIYSIVVFRLFHFFTSGKTIQFFQGRILESPLWVSGTYNVFRRFHGTNDFHLFLHMTQHVITMVAYKLTFQDIDIKCSIVSCNITGSRKQRIHDLLHTLYKLYSLFQSLLLGNTMNKKTFFGNVEIVRLDVRSFCFQGS
tara:strand:- start:481 stop:2022 length:1542 start_codon:yes stop_codon:yes gene_type:complete